MEKKFLPKIYTGNDSLAARWFVEYKEDGKRKRIYGNINRFDNLEDRFAAAQKIIAEIQEGKRELAQSETEKIIYSELEKHREKWRPKTYSCKKCKLQIFLQYMRGKQYTKESIYNFFFDYLTKRKKLSPSTYNDYIVCVAQGLRWCGYEKLIEDIKKRKFEHTPAGYFTKSQKDFLITQIKERDEDLWFFVQFVYYCFLRPRTELRLMKVSDVILEDRKILVRSEISKNKKQQYIAIPNAFFSTVERKLKGRNPNGYIFPGTCIGEPMGVNTYAARHLKILRELKFDTKRYKLYSWKHTGAVMAVRAGVHIKQLQIQLRHHSLDQVDAYLRQLGVSDLGDLQVNFPAI